MVLGLLKKREKKKVSNGDIGGKGAKVAIFAVTSCLFE